MSTLGTLSQRLATGLIELGEIIVQELLLGGDPVTAFLVLGGLSIWAVTFGICGYLALRAVLSGAWRRLTERQQNSFVR
jgi:hypothetical protein